MGEPVSLQPGQDSGPGGVVDRRTYALCIAVEDATCLPLAKAVTASRAQLPDDGAAVGTVGAKEAWLSRHDDGACGIA